MKSADTIYIDLFFDEADKRPQVLQYFMERPYGTLNLLQATVNAPAESKIPMRSAWVISHLGEYHPQFLQSYYNELIDTFLLTKESSPLRSLGKAIVHLNIKEYRLGELFDFCCQQSADFDQAVAVRVNCLYILQKSYHLIPDLKMEVKQLAELLYENVNQPSLRSVLKKIILDKK